MTKPKSKTLEKLEKLNAKFDLAKQTLDEIIIEPISTNLPMEAEVVESEIVPYTETEEVEIFSVHTLKKDFGLVRENIMKLIHAGQNILSQAAVMDLGDLKASQIDALSNLQNTIGNNLKLLISIYKEITDIEHKRGRLKGPSDVPEGGIQNNTLNQIVFNGSTKDLAKMLKEKNDK